MIRKVIDYIKKDEFEIKVDNDYIDIINYNKVNYMEDEKISIDYDKGKITIKGKGLSVIKLLNNEMLIKGNFTTIEFWRNNE